jgi:hypothetical protein
VRQLRAGVFYGCSADPKLNFLLLPRFPKRSQPLRRNNFRAGRNAYPRHHTIPPGRPQSPELRKSVHKIKSPELVAAFLLLVHF